MFTQHSVYILGLVNLFLAGVAIFCVVQAEDHPEYFPLVYIAVSIFIFYMGTIFTIIILQISETYQEQQQRRRQRQNQSLLGIQIPMLTTPISSQLNAVMDNSLEKPAEPNLCLSRSHTSPIPLSPTGSHKKSSTSTLLSTLKDLNNRSSDFITATSHLSLLPHHQAKFLTVHENYQSFTLITNDHRHPP